MRISDWSSDVCSSDLVASIMSPRARLALAADLAMVVIFAAIGRAEHDRGNVVLGVLETAWPFLVGVLVGWLLVRLLGRREALDLGAGVTVVIIAVVVGMLLRVVIGEGDRQRVVWGTSVAVRVDRGGGGILTTTTKK